MKSLLHFAHANGFPAGSYNKLFRHLSDTFDVIAIEKMGHTQQFPVSTNWQYQIDELADYLRTHATQPVVGVGHSFGAVVTYMTACRYPELFKYLVLLDPPIVSGWMRHVMRMLKRSPLIDVVTPAGKSKIRNTRWHRDEDLMQYFQSRRLFKYMDPDCVQDYITAVMVEEEEHLSLDFCANVETQIYRNIPHNLDGFSRKFTVPGTLVTAKYSEVSQPLHYKRFIRLNKLNHVHIENAGHMFPLERPLEVAEHIVKTVSDGLK